MAFAIRAENPCFCDKSCLTALLCDGEGERQLRDACRIEGEIVLRAFQFAEAKVGFPELPYQTVDHPVARLMFQ